MTDRGQFGSETRMQPCFGFGAPELSSDLRRASAPAGDYRSVTFLVDQDREIDPVEVDPPGG